ncbi:MAG TPA: hypothetical protein VIM25_06245 [Candidatus Limnocylindrales bacterium]
MAGEAAPLTTTVDVEVAAAATAASASGLEKAPFAGTLASATIIALAALTGANTNSRTIQVFNRGQAGLGTTVMASLAFVTGVNLVAEDETALTLSVTAANLVVADGDVIEVQSLTVGTGLAAPQFIAKLGFSRVAGA